MEISGSSSSLYQYYLELAQQKKASASQNSVADLFSKADSDSDGSVSASEFASILAQSGGTVSNGNSTTDTTSATTMANRPPPPPPPPPVSMSEDEIGSMFEDADSDGDGVLSQDEFAALSEKLRPSDSGQQGGQVNTQDLLAQLGAASGYENMFAFAGQQSGSIFSEALRNLTSSSGSDSTMASYMQGMLKEVYGA